MPWVRLDLLVKRLHCHCHAPASWVASGVGRILWAAGSCPLAFVERLTLSVLPSNADLPAYYYWEMVTLELSVALARLPILATGFGVSLS